MSGEQSEGRHLERAEWILGLALSLLALYFHLRCLTHAGALWRDEANMVAVATGPSWASVAGALEHESFPILPFAVVRIWSALGVGGTDLGLRLLGFLVGAGILGALWLDASLLGVGVPLLSLSLFALNPVVLRWGDSLRGYGMGTLLFLLLYGALFRAGRRGSRLALLASLVLALLAVQGMYQNALLLFGVSLAALAAAGRARRLALLASVCGIGALCAASLLPYLGVIARARDHFAVITLPPDRSRIWHSLVEALGRTEPGMGLAGKITPHLWLLLTAATPVLGIVYLLRQRVHPAEEGSAACRYGISMLLLTPALILLFLLRLSFRTEPWYYVLLLGAVAIALDSVLGVFARGGGVRALRIACAASVAAVSIAPLHAFLELRHTNVDLVARELERRAGPRDLIVLDPWFYAISFGRYYRGPTPWTTLPPLADHHIHRFDLLKEQMKLADAVLPIRERAAATLRSGHVVWILGALSPTPDQFRRLPPAPSGPQGWYSDPYLVAWRDEIGAFLRSHAAQGEGIEIPSSEPISTYELMMLWRIEGWVGPG